MIVCASARVCAEISAAEAAIAKRCEHGYGDWAQHTAWRSHPREEHIMCGHSHHENMCGLRDDRELRDVMVTCTSQRRQHANILMASVIPTWTPGGSR